MRQKVVVSDLGTMGTPTIDPVLHWAYDSFTF
jgi:hypothetical protein